MRKNKFIALVFFVRKNTGCVAKKNSLCVFIVSLCLLFACSVQSYSQENLNELLKGKTKLPDIMAVVDAYYLDHPAPIADGEEEFESEYLHWKRWEWYMSGRLGHGGEFVNIPEMLYKGLVEKESMHVSQDRNINSLWTFMGPSSSPLQNNSALYNGIGRVDRIVFHPTNQNIIFICTPAGGLWSTLNGGTTWNNLTDNLPSIGASGFVISWANTSEMYLLTGDGDSSGGGLVQQFGYARPCIGVLKSMDGGISWHQTGTFPAISTPFAAYKMVQSPTDPEILLVTTNSGLYRTTDGGATWNKRVTGTHYDVEFKPGDGTRCYSTVQGDFWLSTDSGLNWTSNSTYDVDPISCVINNTIGGRIEIAVSPISPLKVYLLAGPVTVYAGFCGLWLSTDGGLTFTQQSNSPNILGAADNGVDGKSQSFYDLGITCRADNSSSIATAGLTVWRSTNGGTSWTHSTSYNENGSFPYIHPDVHDIAYNWINDWLYAASDGGFFRSQDFGVTWTDLSPNIESSQFYHMAGWDGNINKLMGGLQDNGVKYRKTNSSAFYHIDGADGFEVVFNPVTGEPGYSSINSSILKYSSDGNGSADVTTTEDSLFFKTLAIHNTNPDILLVGTQDIFKTTDGGSNYSNEGASGSWALTSCPSNSTRFYAAGGAFYGNGAGTLYFSANTGDSWTAKSGNPGFPSSANWIKITDVVVNPNNSSVVWACFGGFDEGYKVVTSNNTGDTWTNMSANLPNVPVNCLAIDNDNGVYAGTDIGIFYRSPTMLQWMPWSNGLPNTPVTELVIYDDGTTKRIRAATFGRGVWQSDLAETCDAAVVVTGGLEGIRHYEASSSINSTSFIQGGIGTFVSFKSGNYITLSDGFNVVDESEFLGFISPCGVGGIPSIQENGINRADANSSIILLRRFWDKEAGLPFGSIDNIEIKSDRAFIQFSVKKSGKVQLYAAREIQENLTTLYNQDVTTGSNALEVDISKLPSAFHYLLLFYEGKLVHFQEMDLR